MSRNAKLFDLVVRSCCDLLITVGMNSRTNGLMLCQQAEAPSSQDSRAFIVLLSP